MCKADRLPIPVIDLFAGAGGLGEGFSAVNNTDGSPTFRLALSMEKDSAAHKTLMLRSVFHQLRVVGTTDAYYAYMRGELSEESFRAMPLVSDSFARAAEEAKCVELGKVENHAIDQMISEALNGVDTWVLIGGPPCQAYSVVGRARRTNDANFEKDEKHVLYEEYLRVIGEHRPTLFVMENVRGILSSKLDGELIFKRILRDLSTPASDLEYEIRSFVKRGDSDTLEPADYLIRSADYGIPQRRDRVILLGVRKDRVTAPQRLLKSVRRPVSVRQAIGDLPRIRSRVSWKDSSELWYEALEATPSYLDSWDALPRPQIVAKIKSIIAGKAALTPGGRYIQSVSEVEKMPEELQNWILDSAVGGVCQHDARGHMPSDLARYLFASTYADECEMSPSLSDFPPDLWPKHRNMKQLRDHGRVPFQDRFRVQCADDPATTVVSHISKDGHYFIHYDPAQCRSLTVREAARLQTFPDNYLFEGSRTEQYTQVGNAVPPLLAFKLGEIVRDLLGGCDLS